MALESLECMTVESLSVHLCRSAVVLLLRVVRRAAVLMKERQLNNSKNSRHLINNKLSYCKQIARQHLSQKNFGYWGPGPLG